MDTYRLKQADVEAMKLTKETAREVADWCGALLVEEIDPFNREKTYVGLNVPSPNGHFRVSEGNYVIRAPGGGPTNFFTMSAERFERNYEAS